MQPSVVPVAVRDGEGVVDMFQTLEVFAHIVRRPRAVASQRRDVVKVRPVRVDRDEDVVHSAAAESTGARIQRALDQSAAFYDLQERAAQPKDRPRHRNRRRHTHSQ